MKDAPEDFPVRLRHTKPVKINAAMVMAATMPQSTTLKTKAGLVPKIVKGSVEATGVGFEDGLVVGICVFEGVAFGLGVTTGVGV